MQKDTEMLLNIIRQEGTNSFGNHVMDFTKEEHQLWLYEMFGGRENLEKEYPELYKLTQNTISAAATDKVWNTAENDSLQNLVVLLDVESDKTMTGALGRTVLKQPTKRLYQSITLVQNGEEIWRSREFLYDTGEAEYKATMDSSDLPSKKDMITCIYNVIWEDTENGILNAENSVREDMEPYEADVIQEIMVSHPRYYEAQNEKGMANLPEVAANATDPQPIVADGSSYKRTGNINIAYNRDADGQEILDYVYREKKAPKERELFLDIRGAVTLAAGYSFDDVKECTCVLDVTGTGSGSNGGIMTTFNLKKGVHVYDNKEGGFNFAFPTDWGTTIPDSATAGSKICHLEVDLIFTCAETGDQEHHMYIYGSDSLGPDESHYAQVPLLKFKWGCLQKDTKVRMADGTEKKIQDIQLDEEVAGIDGTACKVVNRIHGTEEELYRIKVEGYPDKIGVSKTHPFMTVDGMIAAEDITPSTQLKMEDGEFHRILECYSVDYGGEVYNLELEPNHWFYADGFCTGDNVAQGDCMSQSCNSVSLSIEPELIEEIEKLRREFGR